MNKTIRKGQLKLVEKAKKKNLSQDKINFLETSERSINDLSDILLFFCKKPDTSLKDIDIILYLRDAFKKDYEYNAFIDIMSTPIKSLREICEKEEAPKDIDIPLSKSEYLKLINKYTKEEIENIVCKYKQIEKTKDTNSADLYLANLLDIGYYALKKWTNDTRISFTNYLYTIYPPTTAYKYLIDDATLYAGANNIPIEEIVEAEFSLPRLFRNRFAKAYPELARFMFEKMTAQGLNEYNLQEIDNVNELNGLWQFYSTFSESGTITISNPARHINFKATKDALNISLLTATSCSSYANVEYWHPVSGTKNEFVLFYDGGFYKQKQNKKYFPCQLKTLLDYDFPVGVFNALTSEFNQKAPYFTEFIRTCQAIDFIPPISINECLQYQTINDLFQNKYKDGHFMEWTMDNFEYNYNKMKAAKRIVKEERVHIYEMSDLKEYHNMKKMSNCLPFWVTGVTQVMQVEIIIASIINNLKERLIDKEGVAETEYLVREYVYNSYFIHKRRNKMKICFNNISDIPVFVI